MLTVKKTINGVEEVKSIQDSDFKDYYRDGWRIAEEKPATNSEPSVSSYKRGKRRYEN